MNRAHAFEEIALILAPETELAAVEPLVDEIRRDFLTIRIEKHTFGIAAGGPGFEYLEIGLVVVVATAAYEFLKAIVSEAGRDTYGAVKDALTRTGPSAYAPANDAPFGSHRRQTHKPDLKGQMKHNSFPPALPLALLLGGTLVLIQVIKNFIAGP